MSFHDIVFQTQGKRKEQEDAFTIFQLDDKICVAIFDGHSCGNNDSLSLDLATRLPKIFNFFFQKRSFNETNIIDFFQRLDTASMKHISGTCACLFFAEKDDVYFAMVGDTEAIVIQDKILYAFTLHNFKNDKEVKRYRDVGMSIHKYRYCGLNISRTFGDSKIRTTSKHPLAPIPSIQHFKVQNPIHVFMFTDGIRELVQNSDFAAIVEGGYKTKIATFEKKLEKHEFYDNATLIAFEYSYKKDKIDEIKNEIKETSKLFYF